MSERKVWRQEEDKILKYLREERGQRKWANIARLMEQEFNIVGRTGKQCRERYHNHLDSSIVTTEWTQGQQQILYRLHEQIGNKWSIISHQLPGRSDNCVKNHFYSKLRKAIRKLNKIITEHFAKDLRSIKNCMLSKIIQTTQSKFKMSSKVDEETADFCNNIKNRLVKFEVMDVDNLDQELLETSRDLIQDILTFDKDYKKNHKTIKKNQHQIQYKTYLKPPPNFTIRRQLSSNSCSSEVSDDGSSFLSSQSYISSCSDLSEYDNPRGKNQISETTGTRSLRTSSARNSDIAKQQQDSLIKKQVYYNREQKEQYQHQQDEILEHNQQIKHQQIQQPKHEQDSQQRQHQQHGQMYNQSSSHQRQHRPFDYYNDMFYEDTLFMARVLAPSRMDEEADEDNLLQRENSQIQYKQQGNYQQ